MSIPLDPALYEDLTPSVSQQIAAALGQSLGLFGSNQLQNYMQRNRLAALGLPPQIADLPSNLQQAALQQAYKERDFNRLNSLLRPGTSSADMPASPGAAPSTPPASSQPPSVSGTYGGAAIPAALDAETIAVASTLDPQAAKILQQDRAAAIKGQQKREEQNFKFNEPKIEALGSKLQTLRLEKDRLDRMEVLNQSTLSFPSRFTVAMLSRDGQLTDFGYSQLSDEAQEFYKVVQDSLNGAKETFGARVTNFDVQNYLRRLPSLLNSPGGRDRVIRDLQKINEINRLYDQGILNVFEEKGGSRAIAYSQAESIVRKRYKKEFDRLSKEFVYPEGEPLKSLPPAAKSQGEYLKNSETGEIFYSDGQKWVPLPSRQGS